MIVKQTSYLNFTLRTSDSSKHGDRSYDQFLRPESLSIQTRNYRSLTQKSDWQPRNSIIDFFYYSADNHSLYQSPKAVKKIETPELEAKIKSLEKKNKDLERKIAEIQAASEELVKEHNREISELKCNLRNSIFEEEPSESKNHRQSEQVWSFAAAPLNKIQQYSEDVLSQSITQVQFQIRMLREENQLYRQQISALESKNPHPEIVQCLNDTNKQLAEIYEGTLNQRVIQLEKENIELQDRLNSEKLPQNPKLLELLKQFDDQGEVSELYHHQAKQGEPAIAKIIRLLRQYQDLELELDDWKRNYWILEKRVNQLELEDEPMKTKQSQIEIEYDFKNNQLLQCQELKDQLQQEREKASSQKEELDQLRAKLQLLQSSNNKFSEHFRNQQTSRQPQQQFSPFHFSPPVMTRNMTSHSPIQIKQRTTSFYPVAPIIFKQQQQRLSPFHYVNISRVAHQ